MGRKSKRRAAEPRPSGTSARMPSAVEPSAAAAPPASRSHVPSLIAAAVVLAAVTGAFFWRRAAHPGAAVRTDPGLSVLLVTIDTLRADALGAYGNTRAETPWIDRLAAQGVRFDRAHAHNVVTLPSHTNLLSGLYPLAHGVRDNSGFRFPADRPTLATLLRARGYRTGAFVSAFPLDSRFGLDTGFEVYDDRVGASGEVRSAFTMSERKGPATVSAATAWLARHAQEKTFLFVHLYEPHFAYEPPEPFASRFRDNPYEGEVAAADAALEPLLKPLLEQAGNGRTLVVLTGDHGESLGEHGEMTHGIFAYEGTLRVPLILYAPHILSPAVVREPVRHVDVLPTILEALGLAPPPGLAGRSLLAAAASGTATAAPAYFEALSSSLNQGWAPLRGVTSNGLKYVDLPLPELYDLAADPREEHNLAATRPQDLERLRAVLGRLRADDRGTERVKEDPATLERLHALGYVAAQESKVKEHYTEADDPKRLIDVDRRSREVITLYRAGDLDGALRLVKENLAQRPDMQLGYLHLAYLERARGDLAAAVAAAKRAFELRPLDAETVSLYGVYLTESGHPREAAEVLEPYMTGVKPDVDVITARGMALAAVGRRQEALQAFDRALQADPTNAQVLINIGTVHLMGGDHRQAGQAFVAALELDPSLAKAHNSLGVIAAQEGRLDEAVAHWRQAVALNPSDWQTLFNLGSTLRAQGRAADARPYLESYLKAAPLALEARDIARVRQWLAQGADAAPPVRPRT